MAQRGLREVDGFGVYLKTRLACNGLCIRNEGEKNQDKFYIWRIRNWVNSGTGEVDLEGKIEFGFSHVQAKIPVRYSDGNNK